VSARETPEGLRARHFSELCDLDPALRAAGLAALAESDPALAADVARLLALDEETEGPIEALRGEVADAAERRLLGVPPAPPPPAQLGAWKLGEKLGAGGMGEVWAAERIEGGFTQRAAVKLVRSGMSSSEIVARFERERQLLARLHHAAIARLLDGGVAPDGRPWFSMERVDGEPITEYARARELPLADRIRLLVRVARAVDAAHRSFVLHRDLKPSNILVTSDGEPKLLDFGLAKLLEPDSAATDPHLTRTDMRALTPAYAAPEQVLGEPVTMATDVYALGVLLFELLTGELPHPRRAPTSEGLADEISRESLERPSSRVRRSAASGEIGGLSAGRLAHRLEGDLDTIALAALKREPERRYPTAAAFADDLERFLDGRPVAARPDSLGYRSQKFVRRHRVAVAAAGLVFLSLAGGLVAVLWQARATRVEAERTARVRDFLASIFSNLDPDLGPGREASAAALLADGARRVDAELGDEPRIAAELDLALGRAWLALDRYDEARRTAARSLELAQASAGPGSVLAAASRALLGEIATAEEDLLGGETDLRAALARLDEVAGPASLEAGRAAAALGRNLNAQQRHTEALTLSERAYGVLARVLGVGNREAVRALLGQSRALRGGDRAAEAAKRIASAREILAATPNVHPVTRALLDVERAEIEMNLRHPAEALAAAETALASLGATLGPGSAARADALRARAGARMQGGDFDGALADIEEAASILRALDPDHPRVASVLLDLALVSEHRGRLGEGIALRREVLAGTLRRLGAESAEVRFQRAQLGAVLVVAERYPEAELELREAIRLENGSAEAPVAAVEFAVNGAVLDLSAALLRTGRPAEAVAVARQRLERLEAIEVGAAGHESEAMRLQLAQALVAVGDPASLAEARRLAEKALGKGGAPREMSFGSGPHDVLPSFVLARVDLAEGQLAAARRHLEETLASFARNGRESSRLAGEAQLLLGETLQRMGEAELAERTLRAAYELLFRRAGAGDPLTVRAKELLAGPPHAKIRSSRR
jgi:serine/threonine protein kinase/tetratricopeptide (TPR) repeat protein